VQKQEFRRITKGPVIEWLKTQISVPGYHGPVLAPSKAAAASA
jgi:hypothetical protein